jgi:N-acetylmuramoyl-L-alanine amidase
METKNKMKTTFLYLIFICSFIVVLGAAPSNNPVHSAQKDAKRINVVVIDPGHGGKDYGASVGNAKEKDIVLDLALRVGKSINATYPDIKVIYTRTKDVFIPLYDRANIANKNKADLFISIHVNGTDKTSVQGTETFVLGEHRSKDNFEVMKKENSVILLEDDYITTYEGFDPHSSESEIMFVNAQSEYLDQSIMFASEIQYQFRQNAKRIDRSVKQAGFLVLRMVAMPSVLIEVGFISHPNERNYMLSEQGKSALSTSIFNAFKDYKKKIENKSNFVVHSEKNNSPVASTGTNINTETLETVNKPAVTKTNTAPNSGNIHFSVQIAASKKKMETSPSNFKGENNVFRIESKDLTRYYTGKYNNYEDAVNEKKRIEKKFPEAFVVAFENNEIISVKKALEKM